MEGIEMRWREGRKGWMQSCVRIKGGIGSKGDVGRRVEARFKGGGMCGEKGELEGMER